jgi:hypothetical protein
MKPYARRNMSNSARVLHAIGVDPEISILASYERPHGLLLPRNRIVCWGKADDWKLVLMAAHERAFPIGEPPFASAPAAAHPFHHFRRSESCRECGPKARDRKADVV